MITFYKVNGVRGSYISVNDETDQVILYNKFNLQSRKDYLKIVIDQVDPNLPTTNTQWIAWAKANYHYINHAAEIAELASIQAILDAIKDL
jgi:hypothetical protein